MNKEFIPKILSIDIGAMCGVAVSINNKIEYTEEHKFTTLLDLHTFVKELVLRWRPDIILAPYPTRFYNTILKHGKMLGVIEVIAEQREILVIEVQDATCKKAVLGKGNAKKPDILKHYTSTGIIEEIGTTSEHILDAILFTDYYFKAIKDQ